MQLLSLLALTGLASAVNTRGSRGAALERKGIKLPQPRSAPKQATSFAKRDGNSTIIPQTEKTASKSYRPPICSHQGSLARSIADHA